MFGRRIVGVDQKGNVGFLVGRSFAHRELLGFSPLL